MSRDRIAIRDEIAGVLQAVEALEKSVRAVDDAGLVGEADAVAKADAKTVNESRPAGAADLKDQGDQNAKANANWPVSEADKQKVASKLVALAKELLAD